MVRFSKLNILLLSNRLLNSTIFFIILMLDISVNAMNSGSEQDTHLLFQKDREVADLLLRSNSSEEILFAREKIIPYIISRLFVESRIAINASLHSSINRWLERNDKYVVLFFTSESRAEEIQYYFFGEDERSSDELLEERILINPTIDQLERYSTSVAQALSQIKGLSRYLNRKKDSNGASIPITTTTTTSRNSFSGASDMSSGLHVSAKATGDPVDYSSPLSFGSGRAESTEDIFLRSAPRGKKRSRSELEDDDQSFYTRSEPLRTRSFRSSRSVASLHGQPIVMNTQNCAVIIRPEALTSLAGWCTDVLPSCFSSDEEDDNLEEERHGQESDVPHKETGDSDNENFDNPEVISLTSSGSQDDDLPSKEQ